MPDIERHFKKITTPVDEYIESQTSGGILLILATIAALVIANSSLYEQYHAIKDWDLGFYLNEYFVGMTLHHWINDGFMVLLFYLLGLEIKREILAG